MAARSIDLLIAARDASAAALNSARENLRKLREERDRFDGGSSRLGLSSQFDEVATKVGRAFIGIHLMRTAIEASSAAIRGFRGDTEGAIEALEKLPALGLLVSATVDLAKTISGEKELHEQVEKQIDAERQHNKVLADQVKLRDEGIKKVQEIARNATEQATLASLVDPFERERESARLAAQHQRETAITAAGQFGDPTSALDAIGDELVAKIANINRNEQEAADKFLDEMAQTFDEVAAQIDKDQRQLEDVISENQALIFEAEGNKIAASLTRIRAYYEERIALAEEANNVELADALRQQQAIKERQAKKEENAPSRAQVAAVESRFLINAGRRADPVEKNTDQLVKQGAKEIETLETISEGLKDIGKPPSQTVFVIAQ